MKEVSKIKIVHLVSDLSVGGVQKVVLDICSSANLDKYDISIYSLNDKSDLLKTYTLSPLIKIRTYNYEYSADFSLLSYVKHIFFKKYVFVKSHKILEDISEDKPDIVHSHVHSRELNLGILIQKKIKCKIIHTQHLLQFVPVTTALKILGKLFRHTYRKYHLIAVSKSVLGEIKEYKLSGKNKTLTLIENKVNLTLFKPTPKKIKDYISVVFVARIGFPKAHKELIQAWSLLAKEPIKKKLFLVGPDGMNNQMQELAQKLVPDDSVIFMGSQYEIAPILNECDFAIFPSHKEGLPIALLEKMAMELPVIVSDIPELTNIVEDKKNGLVFKCGDPVDMAEKMALLLKDAELRSYLGKNARKTIMNRFGSNNIALENENVYERVLKNSF